MALTRFQYWTGSAWSESLQANVTSLSFTDVLIPAIPEADIILTDSDGSVLQTFNEGKPIRIVENMSGASKIVFAGKVQSANRQYDNLRGGYCELKAKGYLQDLNVVCAPNVYMGSSVTTSKYSSIITDLLDDTIRHWDASVGPYGSWVSNYSHSYIQSEIDTFADLNSSLQFTINRMFAGSNMSVLQAIDNLSYEDCSSVNNDNDKVPVNFGYCFRLDVYDSGGVEVRELRYFPWGTSTEGIGNMEISSFYNAGDNAATDYYTRPMMADYDFGYSPNEVYNEVSVLYGDAQIPIGGYSRINGMSIRETTDYATSTDIGTVSVFDSDLYEAMKSREERREYKVYRHDIRTKKEAEYVCRAYNQLVKGAASSGYKSRLRGKVSIPGYPIYSRTGGGAWYVLRVGDPVHITGPNGAPYPPVSIYMENGGDMIVNHITYKEPPGIAIIEGSFSRSRHLSSNSTLGVLSDIKKNQELGTVLAIGAAKGTRVPTMANATEIP
jgi:hypothetical protein